MGQPDSVNLSERVNEVRGLVGSHTIAKEQKKELAIGLRVDAELGWGFLMQAVQDSSPLGSTDFDYQLFESVTGSLKTSLSKPEAVDTLAEEIRQKEQATKAMREGFFSLSENPESVGDIIYESITGQKPNGDILLLNTPLAIVIQVKDSSDYSLLDMRRSDGFFRSEAKIHESYKDKNSLPTDSFSLICLHNTDDVSKKHEVRHGINSIFRKVLEKVKNTTYWPQEFDFSWNKWEQWFKDYHPEEHTKLTENGRTPWHYSVWRSWMTATGNKFHNNGSLIVYLREQVLPNSLNRAKDEIIADYEATHKLNHIDELEKSSVYDNRNVHVGNNNTAYYDYFAEWLDSVYTSKWRNGSQSNLYEVHRSYDYVWFEYIKSIKQFVRRANGILHIYKEYELDDRVKIFGELLVQTPIRVKDKNLVPDLDATFGVEIDTVSNLGNIIESQTRRVGHMLRVHERFQEVEDWGGDKEVMGIVKSHLNDPDYRSRLEAYQKSLEELDAKYRQALISGQRTSLFPVVREWQIHFDQVLSSIIADTTIAIPA